MRSFLCVHCLALLDEKDASAGPQRARGLPRCASDPSHRVVDLSSERDAASLRRHWIRPRFDRSIGWLRVAAQLAAALGAITALFFTLSAWHETEQPLRETTCYLLPMLALAGVSWALLDSLERARRRRYLAVPTPGRRTDAQTLSGRVVGGGSVDGPLTGVQGCGYGAVLAADVLLWHEGRSAGVVIETNDGQILTIPKGPLRLSFRESAGRPATRGQLEHHLDALGPGGRAARNRMLVCAPFPFNYYEAALRVGDRVDVIASTRPVPGADGGGSAYREASVDLQTRGVPWVRLRR